MRRYLLFYGENYYPDGGMNDFRGSFDTILGAGMAFNSHIEGLVAEYKGSPDSIYGQYDHIKTDYWYHIFDTEAMAIIESCPKDDYGEA